MQPSDFLAGVLGGPNAAPQAGFEPQRMNSALLRIYGVDFGTGHKDDTLTLSLANFPLPKVQTNINAIAYLNELRKFAGNTMQEDMNVSFHDYVDRGVANILWNWHFAIHNPRTGQKSSKAMYAKNGMLEATAPSDGTQVGQTYTYDIYNVWPAMLDMGDIDYNSDEPVRINVHFAVDKIVPRAVTGVGGGINTNP